LSPRPSPYEGAALQTELRCEWQGGGNLNPQVGFWRAPVCQLSLPPYENEKPDRNFSRSGCFFPSILHDNVRAIRKPIGLRAPHPHRCLVGSHVSANNILPRSLEVNTFYAGDPRSSPPALSFGIQVSIQSSPRSSCVAQGRGTRSPPSLRCRNRTCRSLASFFPPALEQEAEPLVQLPLPVY
jgi:hypothetical protein